MFLLYGNLLKHPINKCTLGFRFSSKKIFQKKLPSFNSQSRPSVTLSQNATTPTEYQTKIMGKWFLACSAGVVGAVILGGITRTTRSGLSMVEWHLFKEVPPLSHEKWVATFERYKMYPDYKQREQEMTLGQFKFIWWTEYIHRSYGRLLGLMYALPAGYFWIQNWLNKPMKIRIGVLGGLLLAQGLMGWYMVKSGLEDTGGPARVSQYRLTAHLGGALVLYSLYLWSGLSLLYPPQAMQVTQQLLKFKRMAHGAKGLIFLTALSGGLVAGLQAGLIYNEFPKMGTSWVPSEIWDLSPVSRNFFENAATVQFNHRILAETVFCGVMALWLYSRKLPLSPKARMAAHTMAALACCQVGLGISTLLLHVPNALANLHQAGALALLSSAIWLTHELKLIRRIPK